MSRFTTNSRYLVVRRWVDHDLIHQHRPPSLYVSICATLGMVFEILRADGWLSRAVWFGALLLSAAWTGFVFWRVLRIMRAVTLRGDRAFDQTGKYRLPPEYVGSESVLKAHRRRQKIDRK